MQKEWQLIQKTEIRKKFLALRNKISKPRQKEASLEIVRRLQSRGRILTFYSIGSEIDLSPLNSLLLSLRKLVCNRIEEGMLVPYHVKREEHLSVSPLGILEPDPALSKRALLSEIDLILVPALCFDEKKCRLGYGKGYYDKFLRVTQNIPTVGIGFREQLSTTPLPCDPWDIPVTELILV